MLYMIFYSSVIQGKKFMLVREDVFKVLVSLLCVSC
jgi:hypothetical protein